jgi:hypothetical protein
MPGGSCFSSQTVTTRDIVIDVRVLPEGMAPAEIAKGQVVFTRTT